MARSLTARTLLAAEVLDIYLRDCTPAFPLGGASSGVGSHFGPGAVGPTDPAVEPEQARTAEATAGLQGTALDGLGNNAPLRLPNPDWLHHRLTVFGPSDVLEKFRGAAAGSGTVPWQLDLDRMEEDFFHALAGAGQLSLDGARVLSGQLRDAVSRRHVAAVTRVGHSVACPFDLYALVPVPDAILCLGPDHPQALAWLWTHWGTTEAVRHVRVVDKVGCDTKGASAVARLDLRFWSADWTPWRALTKIRADWPGLRFDMQPDYGAA